MYKLQYGFQAKHSTNHALLGLTEKIRESLDSGKFACGFFIDTGDHLILLLKKWSIMVSKDLPITGSDLI